MPAPQLVSSTWLSRNTPIRELSGCSGNPVSYRNHFPPLLVYRLPQQFLPGFVRCELNALAAFPRLGRFHFGG